MLYANTNKINWIILLACITSFIVSPSYNQEIVQAKSEEKTSTGMASWMVQTVSATGKTNPEKNLRWLTHSGKLEDWKTTWISKKDTIPNFWTMERWVEYKIDKLIEVGIDKKLAQPLVENCKRMATSPVHCIIAWASVITAESGWKLKNCYHKNCTWLWAWWLWYDTYEAWIIDWIIRYNKYWYKAKSASFFYPSVGEKSRSRYCTSEHSSWSAVGCPNGQKSAQATWNKLSKLF